MYYIGTKRECESYNQEVVNGQNYDGIYTINWAEVVEYTTPNIFAIIKHDEYECDLELVDYTPSFDM